MHTHAGNATIIIVKVEEGSPGVGIKFSFFRQTCSADICFTGDDLDTY